jgi:hypothetical protein
MRKHSEFLTKLETAHRAVKTNAEPPPPAPEPPPPPTQDDEIANVAEQIGNAVEKLTGIETSAPAPAPEAASPAADAAPPSLFEDEPVKLYPSEGEDDSVSPRPKFDFDDLKFGANFDNDD